MPVRRSAQSAEPGRDIARSFRKQRGTSASRYRRCARRRASPRASSRRTARSAAAPAAAHPCALARSSLMRSRSAVVRQFDREARAFLDEHEQPHVGHPLRIQHAVEVVAFVLHDAGMKALDRAIDFAAIGRKAAIANPRKTRHRALQARHRETPLPAQFLVGAERLDDRVDQGDQRLRLVVGTAAQPVLGHLENHHPERHMDLRRREAGAADIVQRFCHIGDQPVDFGRRRVGHRIGLAAQHRVPHAGDLQNGHGANMRPGRKPVKPSVLVPRQFWRVFDTDLRPRRRLAALPIGSEAGRPADQGGRFERPNRHRRNSREGDRCGCDIALAGRRPRPFHGP